MADPVDLPRGLLDPLSVGPYEATHAMPYGDLSRQYMATRRAPMGLLDAGNINLANRPSVWNPEGGYSTVYSMSFQDGDKHVLLPLVTDDGKIESPDQAIARYRSTGRHLGTFATAELADDYAERLHKQQEELLRKER
jgi:hypothetical protein